MDEEKSEVISELLKCKSRENCCVYGCTSIRKHNRNISYHKFPKPNQMIRVENECGEFYEQDRRKLWEDRLKMCQKASNTATVCSFHFTKEDYHSTGCFDKKILLLNAVPSQSLPLFKCNKYKKKKSNKPRIKKGRSFSSIVKNCTVNSIIHGVENDLTNSNSESEVKEIPFLIKQEPLDYKDEQDAEVEYKFPISLSGGVENIEIQAENTFNVNIKQEVDISDIEIDELIQEDVSHKSIIEQQDQNKNIPAFITCSIKDEIIKEENITNQEDMEFKSSQSDETSSPQNQIGEQTDKKLKNRLVIETLKFNLQSRLLTYSRSTKFEFECEHCNEYFPSKLSLENHILTHKFKEKFQCGECNKIFQSIRNLRRHQLIHNNEFRFICEYCDKKFKVNYYLKRHMLTHYGKKVLNVNSQRFETKMGLKNHLFLHIDE